MDDVALTGHLLSYPSLSHFIEHLMSTASSMGVPPLLLDALILIPPLPPCHVNRRRAHACSDLSHMPVRSGAQVAERGRVRAAAMGGVNSSQASGGDASTGDRSSEHTCGELTTAVRG
uniref:Uncharacterized protein n=1 Tax=Setaria viridis TaxID=4556 RepID=A0A4U6T0S0_SETVI|nr:hypothetical protein SEVIR_9G336000v2 [Setaria viridis]